MSSRFSCSSSQTVVAFPFAIVAFQSLIVSSTTLSTSFVSLLHPSHQQEEFINILSHNPKRSFVEGGEDDPNPKDTPEEEQQLVEKLFHILSHSTIVVKYL